ncbi:DUF3352 domain-containing protein [Candidatus Uabimicrobium amorphum]|uniref:Uncharacterized protein n=1 Tax=Uabimicrobium amorphum TaxID=2596890 RepID=A0A5S9IHS7_UABAM|nr:DUF3352 domain-containing protein [Candidatus Uabimicrobium amorphum]BBM81894.1 hypothetical protein UABAM_00236 [Candidatus Uabimicrobium amorphum]
MRKYLLGFMLLLSIHAHEVKVGNISYYALQQQRFFCVELDVIDSTPDLVAEMDIVVEDSSQKTYSHFLLRGEEWPDFVSQNPQTSRLYWIGRFSEEGKILVDTTLLPFFSENTFHAFSQTLELPKEATQNKALPSMWAMARNASYSRYLRQQRNDYIEHSLVSSASRFRIPVQVSPYLLGENIRNISYTKTSEKNIDIVQVEGLRPYEKFPVKDKNIPTFLMTNIVPKDYYFLHFTSAKGIFNLVDKLGKCQDNLLTQFTTTGRSSSFFEKMLQTLAISFDNSESDSGGGGLGKSLLDWVIADMALVGSDFLLSEGSSYALIVHVKSQFLLDFQLKKYFSQAVKNGATSLSKRYRGISYRKIVDTKKGINSHSCYINNFLVLSNSETMIKNIISTTPPKSLARTNDLLKARSVFAANPQKEQAFLYISRDHLYKINSPQYTISSYRRAMCRDNLRFLQYELLESYSNHRRMPKDLAIPEEMHCADGGKYVLRYAKPTCTVHNHLGYLTPVDETLPRTVYESEHSAYAKFRDSFYGQENEFLSPIAMRIPESKELSAEIFSPAASYALFKNLPKYLINDNQRILKTYLPNVFFAANLSCNMDKVLEDPKVKKYLQQLRVPHLHALLPNLGKQLSLYVCDDDLLFVPQIDAKFYDISTFMPAFVTLPFYSTITIKNPMELERKLQAIIWDIKKYHSIENEIQLNVVKEEYHGKKCYIFKFKYRSVQYSLFLVIKENFLVVTNKRDVAFAFIDDKVDSFMAQANNLEIFVSPKKINKIRENLKWEAGDHIRQECTYNMHMLEVVGRFFPEKTLANIQDTMYGYSEIVCPQGGKYTRHFHRLRCDVHGTNLLSKRKIQPDSVNAVWPDTSVDLNFTDQGFIVKIHLQGAKN